MVKLQERLEAEMREALKGRQDLKLSVLRLAKAAVKNDEIERRRVLTDEEIVEVLSKEVKKRKEAIEGFSKGNRMDLVQKEEAEMAILLQYLPAQMGEEEIRGLARSVIEEIGGQAEGASSPGSLLGKVMGKIMPMVKGKADGKQVNEIVRKELGLV